MNDNPFFSMDQPQAQPTQAQATPSGGSPPPPDPSVGQSNPFFAMDRSPAPKVAQADDDTGYFAPERKVWGMMQSDPVGTAGKIASTAISAPYNAAVGAIGGIKPTVQAMGSETSANTATPDTAIKSLQAAAMLSGGDMMAPGLSGKAVRAGVQTPTEAELLKSGGKRFRRGAEHGVDYSIPHAVDLSHNVEQQLYNQGIGPADAPRTFAKLAEAEECPRRRRLQCQSLVSWEPEGDSPELPLTKQHPIWIARQPLRPWATTKTFWKTLLRRLFWLDPLPPRQISSPKAMLITPLENDPISSPIKKNQPILGLQASTQVAITITSYEIRSDPLLTPEFTTTPQPYK